MKSPFIFRRQTSDRDIEHLTTGSNVDANETLAANEAASGEETPNDELTTPVVAMENNDPYRRRINKHNQGGGIIGKLIRSLKSRLAPPPPTPEELVQMEDKKKLELLKTTLEKDAHVAEENMTSCLNALRICYYTVKEGRITNVKPVRFDVCLTEADALHFHVYRKLPWGVSLEQLVNKETLDNLSHSVGHAINCRYTPETGIWYTIERASGRAGIPNWVDYKTIYEGMPASASSLAIPIGRTHNARLIYEDLGKMVHVLVGGTTGSGKTNFLHVLICTLIQRNTPDSLRLVLVDLKGGLALTRYEGVPHLMIDPEFNPTGIIEKRENVLGLFKFLINEGERRMSTLRAAGAEDIGHYNSGRRKNKLPFIVCVIDEWADMMQTDKGKAEDGLVNVVSRMRSVGIHVILATQSPTSRVITGLIKVNLPARFAFSVPNNQGSMAIIDDASAAGLQPTGRCIMQYIKQIQIQTPYLPVEFVDRIVRTTKTGTPEPTANVTGHDVTPREIMLWALEENSGWLPYHKLYERYKERKITVAEIQTWLTEWEGNTFVINNSSYIVAPGSGSKGRRLVAVKENQEEPENANNQTE